MKNKFKILLSLFAVFMIGCTEEEELATADNSVVFKTTEAYYDGYMKLNTAIDGNAKICLPYYNNGASETEIGVSASQSLQDYGLTLPTSFTASPGAGELEIPISGTLAGVLEGDNITLQFSAFSQYESPVSVSVNAEVLGEFYELPNLEITSVVLEAFVMSDGSVRTKDEVSRVAIYYANAYGRTASFAVETSEADLLVFTPANEVEALNSGDTEGVVYVDLIGTHTGTEDIDLTAKATIVTGDDDEIGDVVDKDFTITPIVSQATSIESIELDAILRNGKDFSGNLVVKYYFGNGATVNATNSTVTITDDASGTLAATLSEVTLADGEGTLTIPVTGSTTASEVLVAIALKDASNTDICSGEETMTVYINTIDISSVELIQGTALSGVGEDYILRVYYGAAVLGNDLTIDMISTQSDAYGSLIVDTSYIPYIVEQKISVSNSYVDFTLDKYMFTDTSENVNEKIVSDGSFDGRTVAIQFKYGGQSLYDTEGTVLTFDTKEFTIVSIVGNGVVYNTIEPGDGKVWLDRNLGATEAQSSANPVFVEAAGTPSSNQKLGFSNNKNAYGTYFQLGKSVGIPLIMSGHPYYDKVDFYTTSELTSPTNNTPFFMSNAAAADTGLSTTWSSGTWDQGYWTENNTYSSGQWTSDADGGTNNPCPSGFRIPTQEELANLIQTITGLTLGTPQGTDEADEDYVNDYTFNRTVNIDQYANFTNMFGQMVAKFQMPFAGSILEQGPTVNGTTPYYMGQKGVVGVSDANMEVKVDGVTQYYRSGYIGIENGYMNLWTSTPGTTSTDEYVCMQISNTINLTWPETSRNAAMPIRCIRNQ